MSETTFTDLQEDIRARLCSDLLLGPVAFITEDKGDVASDLAQRLTVLQDPALAGHSRTYPDGSVVAVKPGIVGLVRMPIGLDEFAEVDFGPLDFDMDVTIIEDPRINRATGGSLLRALTVARRVHRLLKNYLAAGIAQNLVARKPCILPSEEFAPLPAYNVMFSTREADSTNYQKVATPVFSGSLSAPGPLTLTCATAGAKIYWSADGSHPSPSSGGDVLLYTAPFATGAAVYRAAAFPADLTTMMESDVASVRVT